MTCFSLRFQGETTLIEVTQQLFLIQDHHKQLSTKDFEIEDGFPRNCSQESNLLILEPDIMQADRFYPLVSGQLVVPHRFWIFDRSDYCMEDFFINNDFNKVCATSQFLRHLFHILLRILPLLGEKNCNYLHKPNSPFSS